MTATQDVNSGATPEVARGAAAGRAADCPFITTKLAKSFGDKQVLCGVDLRIEPGEVLGLLGQNGSGKSTLIKCALGLLRPTAGQARIFGDDAWDLSAETKARIGYVPQEVASYPWMRVRQVIAYHAAFYPGWNHKLVAELCDRWRLPLEERVGPLSVGQLQALGIVLALGPEPELLVLDEPVASLDPAARRQFLRTLLEIIEDPRRAVLFSTHITSDLERVAGQVAILRDGELVYSGEQDALKERVKRLRITAQQPLPQAFAVPGAVRYDIDGPAAAVTVDGYTPELAQELRRVWDAEVEVDDLNLEEIFVDMHT
ncbi:putative ABC transporter ATP-binding protein YxlF [Pirellulimonas nuda]|uniref:Putative ABC transporter ATP-binding protein YxlF n=1 Tax=Pirellulimonas nuda TaxID=2528009 RepID=A0A518DJT3_9BACT|nr:ABC transporter ATP-binding protein [Pirellulimonas nuda]QDU91702.1 putative ABC transporter ATP-binding protein YxlF [Pirellulimonas nuda]